MDLLETLDIAQATDHFIRVQELINLLEENLYLGAYPSNEVSRKWNLCVQIVPRGEKHEYQRLFENLQW